MKRVHRWTIGNIYKSIALRIKRLKRRAKGKIKERMEQGGGKWTLWVRRRGKREEMRDNRRVRVGLEDQCRNKWRGVSNTPPVVINPNNNCDHLTLTLKLWQPNKMKRVPLIYLFNKLLIKDEERRRSARAELRNSTPELQYYHLRLCLVWSRVIPLSTHNPAVRVFCHIKEAFHVILSTEPLLL